MCNKELKIHQKKENERERERENSRFCVGKIWVEWKKWKQIFIVNKMEREEPK